MALPEPHPQCDPEAFGCQGESADYHEAARQLRKRGIMPTIVNTTHLVKHGELPPEEPSPDA